MFRHSLETDLKIEREWRSGMQTELSEEKEKVDKLEKELAMARLAVNVS